MRPIQHSVNSSNGIVFPLPNVWPPRNAGKPKLPFRVLMLNRTVVVRRGKLSVNLLPLPSHRWPESMERSLGNPAEMQQLIHPRWCAQVFVRYATRYAVDPLGRRCKKRSQVVAPLAAWTDGGRQNSAPFPHGCGTMQPTCAMPWPKQPKSTRNNTVR